MFTILDRHHIQQLVHNRDLKNVVYNCTNTKTISPAITLYISNIYRSQTNLCYQVCLKWRVCIYMPTAFFSNTKSGPHSVSDFIHLYIVLSITKNGQQTTGLHNTQLVSSFSTLTSSKSPRTTCTSLARVLRQSNDSLVHRLPVHRMCWILPGTRSFLKRGGSELHR